MHIDNRRVLAIARQVIRHINKRGDRPLAILAGIVHKVRLDHILGAHAATSECVS